MNRVLRPVPGPGGPTFGIEAGGPLPVAGIDEVGRGPWAGPIVAAAVILDPAALPAGLNDSKRLTARRREALHDIIHDAAQVGIGQASVEEIFALGLLPANDLAMHRALAAVGVRPARVLVDGNRLPPDLGLDDDVVLDAVVKGDACALSIAAASIVAKVTRDRIMAELARDHPGYGWERNAGYGTAEHQAGLRKHGVSPHHRRGFKPIHNILCESDT